MAGEGIDAFKAADLREHVISQGRLTDLGGMFLDVPTWNAKRVGNRLRALNGKWIDGVRLVRPKGDAKKGHVYQIERKDGADPEYDETPAF